MNLIMDRRMMLLATGCAAVGTAFARSSPSRKKGFGLVTKNTPDWQARLRALNPGWYYTWGVEQPDNSPAGIEFVPMQWGKWGCTQEKMEQMNKAGHKTLLGFNEPEQRDQANMTVEKALELWPILMDSGMRLGSPSGVQPDGEWMTAFMEGVKKRGYRVDFITIHSYRGISVPAFLEKIESVQKLYKKPVWITEFAVADWSAKSDKANRFSPEDVCGFMETALPALDKMDYVERYAWFSGMRPQLKSSSLFNDDGSLNRLGELYASI